MLLDRYTLSSNLNHLKNLIKIGLGNITDAQSDSRIRTKGAIRHAYMLSLP